MTRETPLAPFRANVGTRASSLMGRSACSLARGWCLASGLVALFTAGSAQAQIPAFATNAWRSSAPCTAIVYQLAASRVQESLVFGLGAGNQVFRTDDGGEVWAPAENFPLHCNRVLSLMADPADPARVYAWTVDDVYLSGDRGTSWALLHTFPHSSLREIAVDPTDSGVVFAATTEGLFRSMDGGVTWNWMRTDWGFRTFFSVAVDPDQPSTVYAAGKGGVHRSVDHGETWRLMAWPGIAPTEDATAVGVVPSNPKAVVASGHGGFYRSIDEGLSWSQPSLPQGFDSSMIRLDPRNPGLVFLMRAPEILISRDGGLSWSGPIRPPRSNHEPLPTFTHYAGHERLLVSGFDGKLYRSDDLGATWVPGSLGVPGGVMGDMALEPGSVPGTLYASPCEGLFHTEDGARTWQLVHSGGFGHFTIDPNLPSRMWSQGTYALLVSEDGGVSWSERMNTGGSTWFTELEALPTTPTTLLSSIAGYSYMKSFWGVHLSLDGGETWRQVVPDEWGPILSVDPFAPWTVFASGQRLFRSLDAGATWVDVTDGFPDSHPWLLEIAAVPETPWVLFGLFHIGVYRSTDAGTTWSAYAPLPPTASWSTIAVIGGDRPAVLGIGGTAVWVWDEAMGQWRGFGTGLPRAYVTDLLVDQRGEWTVYAGTNGRGVYALDLGQRPVHRRLHQEQPARPNRPDSLPQR